MSNKDRASLQNRMHYIHRAIQEASLLNKVLSEVGEDALTTQGETLVDNILSLGVEVQAQLYANEEPLTDAELIEVGRRFVNAAAALEQAGICFKRVFNEKTEKTFPHSEFSYSLSFYGYDMSFRAQDNSGNEEPIAEVPDEKVFYEYFLKTLEAAVAAFRKGEFPKYNTNGKLREEEANKIAISGLHEQAGQFGRMIKYKVHSKHFDLDVSLNEGSKTDCVVCDPAKRKKKDKHLINIAVLCKEHYDIRRKELGFKDEQVQ